MGWLSYFGITSDQSEKEKVERSNVIRSSVGGCVIDTQELLVHSMNSFKVDATMGRREHTYHFVQTIDPSKNFHWSFAEQVLKDGGRRGSKTIDCKMDYDAITKKLNVDVRQCGNWGSVFSKPLNVDVPSQTPLKNGSYEL